GTPQRVVKSLYLGEGELEAHNWKLHARYLELEEKEARFESFLTDDAELVVAAFGSAARIAKTAVMMAREQGMKVGLLRPVTLFPFPAASFAAVADRGARILTVELNTGQMVDDVRLAVKFRTEVDFYGRAPGAGSLPVPEEILEQITKRYRVPGTGDR
ncbi:MAG TPA: 3-methyl-2-oxobutanoate dehydrogenase subunit beta, partial [Verrucomicrobiae bacterium]|nr:3-methyl-2-oxobutanoate dehydrogenase subunit beta [Verrucomicrobiae bacterium]